jgi:DNA ligase (NAD+)
MDIEKVTRQKELTALLNRAAFAYYQGKDEIMSNLEYDRLYDELAALEEETQTVLSDSPTIHVGYEVLSELPKERHERPMLSLDKTKEPEALKSWLGAQKGLLSWKLDGLTIVLTYQNGELAKAVTRGNGEVGEVITGNARVFQNIPLKIAYQGELILRGEAVISYSEFERINREMAEESEDGGSTEQKYKNPRNLCSGTVRQLNNEITAKRKVSFYAFSLVKAYGIDFKNSRKEQLLWLSSQGFDVVEYKTVEEGNILSTIAYFSEKIVENDVPSDGLVLLYDDISYGQSLGRTAKFPRDSIAFKWQDETAETVLREIEWSASRTGLINPVAVFDPVELEGTSVSRASVHNVSIVESLKLGIGDRLLVYKANMIIPQIAENLTQSGNLAIPESCPVCGYETQIRKENDVKSLFCTNPDCQAKKIKAFTLFVSRDAMNIEGLSEATLEKFVDLGLVREPADLFRLSEHRDTIVSLDGFGEKSYENLIAAVDRARETEVYRFLYSLGIPNVGVSNAKLICKEFGNDFEKIRTAKVEELVEIPGVGEVIAESFCEFFGSEEKNRITDHVLGEITLKAEEKAEGEQKLAGKTFVITGSVEKYANRKELKDFIESLGGKVTGSVTGKTDYLINNDAFSSSGKNKKAKELGVEVITEDEFQRMV